MTRGTTGSTEEAFPTSGLSGEPVRWMRTHDQLHAEVELLAESIVGQVDRVVNYAPTRHLYGRLLGELLPEHVGVPVLHLWSRPWQVPDLGSDERTLLVCLPSTWLMLRSFADRADDLRNVTAVHSTGPATPATRQVLARLTGSGFRAVEILGATETGAVAHRTLLPRPARPSVWTLFPDVDLVADPDITMEQPLRIRSPRIARRADQIRPPAEMTLEDLVRPAGERRFELLGRATRMIKINGRRLHLEDVEQALRTRFPHVDLVCLPRRDEVRAEHYELFYADDTGAVTEQGVHAVLAEVVPGLPVPRRVVRVPAVPRSATGKVRIDRLLAAARERSGSEAVEHAR
jgi:acyl-coenzyme A synthetase/AMP-(fatty) acid ligase